MKPTLLFTFLSFILCSISYAEIPQKKPLQSYSSLWLNSPFTTPPEKITEITVANPFENYHLTGIAPVEGGYRIIIANKKDKTANKIVIEPGNHSGYKVVSVERNPEQRLGTTVTLTNGTKQGVVRFEPSLVVLNTPVTSAKPAQNLPPGFDPKQQNQPNNEQGTPQQPTRSRIVAPAKPQQNPSNRNQQSRPSRTR